MHNTLGSAARLLKNAFSLGPKWHFKAKQAAANFSLSSTNMAVLSLFQDGVSGVHKMTRYKDGGLLGKIFLTV
jgi:hypothetical protein